MDYLGIWMMLMTMTTLLHCQSLHRLYNLHHMDDLHHLEYLHQWDHLYHLDPQGLLLPLPIDLHENVIQVSNGSYKWPTMMRRMSKCTFPSNFLLIITIS